MVKMSFISINDHTNTWAPSPWRETLCWHTSLSRGFTPPTREVRHRTRVWAGHQKKQQGALYAYTCGLTLSPVGPARVLLDIAPRILAIVEIGQPPAHSDCQQQHSRLCSGHLGRYFLSRSTPSIGSPSGALDCLERHRTLDIQPVRTTQESLGRHSASRPPPRLGAGVSGTGTPMRR